MTKLTILTYPDPRLREVAKPVTQFDKALENLIQDMLETMYHDNGCGLAATQVGINQRIFVADLSLNESQPRHFINPEIIERSGEHLQDEGCLSFPGIFAKVKRPNLVRLKYQDKNGIFHEENFSDLGAVCCEHEIEHLDGIVFIDHLSLLKRNYLIKKLKKNTPQPIK